MNPNAVASLALLLSLSAQAEWVEVARNSDLAVFQDPSTDRTEGAVVHTRELRDYIKPEPFFTMNIGSRLIERQYDCAARKSHLTRADMFETRMAEGKPFDWSVMTDAPWVPIADEALGEESMKAACSRSSRAIQK